MSLPLEYRLPCAVHVKYYHYDATHLFGISSVIVIWIHKIPELCFFFHSLRSYLPIQMHSLASLLISLSEPSTATIDMRNSFQISIFNRQMKWNKSRNSKSRNYHKVIFSLQISCCSAQPKIEWNLNFEWQNWAVIQTKVNTGLLSLKQINNLNAASHGFFSPLAASLHVVKADVYGPLSSSGSNKSNCFIAAS